MQRHFLKIFALIEQFIGHLINGLRQGKLLDGRTRKCTLAKAFQLVMEGDPVERRRGEGVLANRLDLLRYHEFLDALHAIEGTGADGSYRGRNRSCGTAADQCVRGCLYDAIAVVARIEYTIIWIDGQFLYLPTTVKSIGNIDHRGRQMDTL